MKNVWTPIAIAFVFAIIALAFAIVHDKEGLKIYGGASNGLIIIAVIFWVYVNSKKEGKSSEPPPDESTKTVE